jgi:hypothetical protein
MSPLVLCSLDAAGEVHLDQVDRPLTEVHRQDVPREYDGIDVLVGTMDGLESLLDDLDALRLGCSPD